MSRPAFLAVQTEPASFAGLAGHGVNRLATAALRRCFTLAPRLGVARARGLSVVIEPLLRGNSDLGADIYLGRFRFAGQSVEDFTFDRLVKDAPGEPWLEAFHGFGWLADMQANDRALSRVQSRALIAEWLDGQQQHDRIAARTDVLARRQINWIGHAGFVLEGASEAFHNRFLQALSRQAARLVRRHATATRAADRLMAMVALAHSSTGLAGFEHLRAGHYGGLIRELDDHILADGGPVSRNPVDLVDLLIDLLPLRRAMERARIEVPEGFNGLLERMLPMVRFFAHGDGGVAMFNGAWTEAAGRARAIVDCDEVLGKPLSHAPMSGYVRMTQSQATVIADIGGPPPAGRNPRAGSGPLAFEFSDGPCRIVVNCGAATVRDAGWEDAARQTAGCSTICVDGENAGQIHDGRLMRTLYGSPVVVGPPHVGGEMRTVAEGSILDASHDGYLQRAGVAVRRRLFLAASGRDLRGEDCFEPDFERLGSIDSVPFAIRFHLHPGVKATLSRDGGSVMLVLPNKSGWRFSTRGGQLKLEDSIYLPGGRGSRRSQQIVVTGTVGRPDRVMWAFKRIDRRKGAVRPAESRETAAPDQLTLT